MADLTLGPTYPDEGTLSLTTTWKSIEVRGEAGFVVVTNPPANMVYSQTPGGSGTIQHPVSTTSGPVSIWSRPVRSGGVMRNVVYVKLTSGSASGIFFEAR